MTLTPGDLAYMRDTQAETRPTAATLARVVEAKTATGGTTQSWSTPEVSVAARIVGAPDKVPQNLADRYGLEGMTKIVLDVDTDVRSGDRVTVSVDEVYLMVTDGTPDEWATAQIAWAVRQVRPARA